MKTNTNTLSTDIALKAFRGIILTLVGILLAIIGYITIKTYLKAILGSVMGILGIVLAILGLFMYYKAKISWKKGLKA